MKSLILLRICMSIYDLRGLGETFIVAIVQSQVTLDTPVAIGIATAIVGALSTATVTLYKTLVKGYERQLNDRDVVIDDLKAQLERSNKQADAANAALAESVQEGHRALTLAERANLER